MLRSLVWDNLRRLSSPSLRAWIKNQKWFLPVSSRVFGNTVYSRSYYADIDRLESESAQHIADWIVAHLAPQRVLDVGCGSGLLMKALHDRGVSVFGIDLSVDAIRITRERGLEAQPFDLTDSKRAIPLPSDGGQYDLVVSTEVAEHLEPRFADLFVERLTKIAPRIFLTAAEPDPQQGPGLYHFNEQPSAYWIAKIEARGMRLETKLTAEARKFLRERGVIAYLTKPLIFTRSAPATPLHVGVSHDRADESIEAKARWFQSLSVEQRMELLCAFTNLALQNQPSLRRGTDARPASGRVQILELP